MVWFVLAEIFTVVLDVLALRGQSEHEKDIEILLLRQQLCIVERTQRRPCRLSSGDKFGLTVLTARLKAVTTSGRSRLRDILG